MTPTKSASSRPQVMRGALLMVCAAFFFAIMPVFVRLAALDLPITEVVFLRNFFGLVFMLPWLARTGLQGLKTTRISLYWWRAALGIFSMLTWFSALTVLPLAEAVSLNFTAPLFVTIGAALFLGEKVKRRRWTATAIGFLGTLVILRPTSGTISIYSLLVIASTVTMAASIIVIKILSRTESTNAIVVYMVLMMTPLSLLPALPVWVWPSGASLAWVVLLGGAGTCGHILFTHAMQTSDASLVMPFDFIRLPLVAFFGYWLFDQAIDIWTWVGAALIFGAGIYIAQREMLALRRGEPVVARQSAPDGETYVELIGDKKSESRNRAK